MSLVGTRPPTVDEWEQYELHHRSRMSTKPGILPVEKETEYHSGRCSRCNGDLSGNCFWLYGIHQDQYCPPVRTDALMVLESDHMIP